MLRSRYILFVFFSTSGTRLCLVIINSNFSITNFHHFRTKRLKPYLKLVWQIWCSGRDSNPGLRLSPVRRRKAEILGPVEFNLAIFGRRGIASFLLPEPKPEHHAIIRSLVLTFLRLIGYRHRRGSSTEDFRRGRGHLFEMLFFCVDA